MHDKLDALRCAHNERVTADQRAAAARQEEDEALKAASRAGARTTHLAPVLDVTPDAVRQRLHALGVPLAGRGRPRRTEG